ncbi:MULTISPECIES: hypothetical protein [Burkholderia]|uniref:Uncharacterized protein n=1 Tax=Burkholderia savannae TaxID=1637837 RepID=A0ABR5TGP3_9BURK|nr:MULTISPECIES: hypothetical protein [Burkholderia]AOJ70003.1 hypothetical protein WS78_15415 [Burkholderia savannae]AOJ81977.1 hypothetical protein WS86_16060 [Burkholderia savannae]AOK48124.1 hypothetical protein WT60_15620 [Burkholderia sp. MSMB617WGS]KGS07693.1 hypothetical protein X946_2101 [Burkholderia sp. ABCPW 111]KVG44005.1 hypothetical protein WS77_10675 [Burkholderia sp. MSMB0265]
MIPPDPESTFRGLPLTPEQNAEVRHYIKIRTQRGLPWDTPELQAMIRDMMLPPEEDAGAADFLSDETRAVAERAMSSVEDEMDPIEANEEWRAAMEAENMKGLRR